MGIAVHRTARFGCDIASPNRGIRKSRRSTAALDLAKELAQVGVPTPVGNLPPGSCRGPLVYQWKLWAESSHTQRNWVVAAENMDSDQALYSVQQWAHLDQLFADCASAQRWVCLDTAHLQDTSAVLSFIHQAGPCIAHVHLSDATGQHLHLPVGQGSLDIPRIVSALHSAGYQGIYSLECFIPNNTPEKLGAELARVKELLS